MTIGQRTQMAAKTGDEPTSLYSLLYISRSRIAPGEAADVVGRIVETSLASNPARGLTGALLFTGEHFAQVIEGEQPALDWVMAEIFNDTRHDQVMLVDWNPIARRRFVGWSLAYFGPSRFVSDHVTRLIADRLPPDHHHAAAWLNTLLWEFSADNATG